MTDRRIAAACASVLFVGTVLLGLAGADKPPPPGFLVLVAALGALSVAAYLRLRVYLAKRADGVSRLAGRAALEGLAAGVLLMIALMLFGSGEPTVAPALTDRAIGLAVSGAFGAALAVATYSAAAWAQRRAGR